MNKTVIVASELLHDGTYLVETLEVPICSTIEIEDDFEPLYSFKLGLVTVFLNEPTKSEPELKTN